MTAALYEFPIVERGGCWDFVLKRLYSKTSGQDIDLTGATARLIAVDGAGNTVLECTVANGRVTMAGPLGAIVIHLDDSVTAPIPAQTTTAKLFILYPSGCETLYLRGPLAIR